MAESPLDTINARIANAESYASRMARLGRTAQEAGARSKLDEYYRQRNELSGTNPLANVTDEEAAQANADAVGGPTFNAQPWSVYNDPVYQTQLQYGQNAFNTSRINALADKEAQTMNIQDELQARKPSAEQARRRLAGNYAARGMGGGRAGALTRAEAQQNAEELSARTSLRDKISELNRQFVANYGANGSDWLGTAAGASAQSEAVQAAINARLAGLTTVG